MSSLIFLDEVESRHDGELHRILPFQGAWWRVSQRRFLWVQSQNIAIQRLYIIQIIPLTLVYGLEYARYMTSNDIPSSYGTPGGAWYIKSAITLTSSRKNENVNKMTAEINFRDSAKLQKRRIKSNRNFNDLNIIICGFISWYIMRWWLKGKMILYLAMMVNWLYDYMLEWFCASLIQKIKGKSG